MADSNPTGIERLLTPVADWIARHSRVLAAAALVSVVIPLVWLRRLEIDNTIEAWLLKKSAQYQRYQQFLGTFGSEEYVIAAMQTEDPLSAESLERQSRLAARLEKVPGVGGVLSLPQFAAAVWPGRKDWADEARRTPFLQDLLLGPDPRTVGVLAWFRRAEAPADRNRTVEDIEAAVREASRPGFEPRLAGTPLVNVALNRTCARNVVRLVPLAFAVSTAVLALMLRTAGRVAAPLLAVIVAVVWTVGLMAMAQVSLNMVSVALPPLLLVLVLSNGIHLASRFGDNLELATRSAQRAMDGGGGAGGHAGVHSEVRAAGPALRQAAVQRTLRELIRPAFLTSATTAVGFGSLAICEMQPVSELGWFAAIGIMIGLVVNLLVVPGVLSAVGGRAARGRSASADHWSSRTGTAMARFWWIVVPAGVVAAGLCAAGIWRIHVETDVLKFLPSDCPVKRDYEWINEHLTGFYTVEIEARTDPDHEDAVLDAMDRVTAALANRPDVARTIHIGQIVPFIERVLVSGVTGSGQETEKFLKDVSGRFRRRVGQAVALRLSVIARGREGFKVTDLVDAVAREARAAYPASAPVVVTGIVPLLKQAESELVRTQVNTFALAAGVSLLMIGLLYQSLRALVASILPNVLPTVGTFALMAVLGIPLDVATVMIASVAIGIAVDNTIHFLARYQDARRAGRSAEQGAAQAFAKAGRAMVFTSAVAAAGFGMLSFSSFRPLADFGVLTGIAMITALVGDLLVTPATARLVNLWGP